MNKISLNWKFALIILVLVGGDVVIARLALAKMDRINDALGIVTGKLVPRMVDAQQLRDILRRLDTAERGMLAESAPDGVSLAVRAVRELSDTFLKTWVQVNLDAEPKSQAKLLHAKDLFQKWNEVSQEIQAQALAGNMRAAVEMAKDKGRTRMAALQSEISQVVDINLRRMDEETQGIDLESSRSRSMMLAMIVASILMCSGLAFVILRSISRAVGQAVGKLNANSAHMSAAAQQIAISSRELSDASQAQVAALSETSGQARKMSEAVRRNAENARRQCELSLFSENAAAKGKAVVAQMMSAMSEIDASNHSFMAEMKDSSARMGEIVKMITDIGEKTRVINEIVFQTKLLSFNASVEASRAGGQGKGFAIVAEEVRNLAQMSGNAAREIALLLDGSVRKIENIVTDSVAKVEKLLSEGKEKVESGTRVAQSCGQVLDEIARHIATMNEMALDISNSSDDQAKGIGEIVKMVARTDRSAQNNASASVEAARVGERISAEAEGLRQTVEALIQVTSGLSGAKQVTTAMPAGPNAEVAPTASLAPVIPLERTRGAEQAGAATETGEVAKTGETARDRA